MVSFFLIFLAFASLAIALTRDELSASGIISMIFLLCIELFIFSLIGWTVALLIWASITCAFVFLCCLVAEGAFGIAITAGVPKPIWKWFDRVIINTSSIASAFASLWILSRASQVPDARIWDGVKWIADGFTPGLALLGLILLGVGFLYNRAMDRKTPDDSDA